MKENNTEKWEEQKAKLQEKYPIGSLIEVKPKPNLKPPSTVDMSEYPDTYLTFVTGHTIISQSDIIKSSELGAKVKASTNPPEIEKDNPNGFDFGIAESVKEERIVRIVE